MTLTASRAGQRPPGGAHALAILTVLDGSTGGMTCPQIITADGGTPSRGTQSQYGERLRSALTLGYLTRHREPRTDRLGRTRPTWVWQLTGTGRDALTPAPRPQPRPRAAGVQVTGTGPGTGNRLQPGVCREQAARALGQARRGCRLTQQQAATALGWSLAKLTRIEAGTAGIQAGDLRAALTLYQVTDPAQTGRLTRLAQAGRGRPWYSRHPAVPPALGSYLHAGPGSYLQAERSATAISGYRAQAVPGLLQTPDYTRAVLAARGVPLAAERAALTAARQELLTSPACPDITYIIDEAALIRPAGSPAIMAAQLAHLRDTAAHPHITIRITPLTAGAVPPAGTLTAITYPDGTAAAWHSTAGGHTRLDPVRAREQMACLLALSVPADAL